MNAGEKVTWTLSYDFTGVPAIVDLTAMRSAMDRLGKDYRKIADSAVYEVLTLTRFGRFDEVVGMNVDDAGGELGVFVVEAHIHKPRLPHRSDGQAIEITIDDAIERIAGGQRIARQEERSYLCDPDAEQVFFCDQMLLNLLR